MKRRAIAIWLLWHAAACAAAGTTNPRLHPEIVARYPHATGAFTQGLDVVNGELYESGGLYRESFVARWQPGSEQPSLRSALPPEIFAEGLTVLGDKAYLLTWQSGEGFVLDAQTLHIERRFRYAGQGWGLTHDGKRLIMSDGTATLRFIDPATLQPTGTLAVTENGKPLDRLNELEWIDAGELGPRPRLLANIWQTDEIAVIDPDNGAVTARIDLRKLYPYAKRRAGEDVLNGIAFDPADNTLLVTGKRWRHLWRIRVPIPLP